MWQRSNIFFNGVPQNAGSVLYLSTHDNLTKHFSLHKIHGFDAKCNYYNHHSEMMSEYVKYFKRYSSKEPTVSSVNVFI